MQHRVACEPITRLIIVILTHRVHQVALDRHNGLLDKCTQRHLRLAPLTHRRWLVLFMISSRTSTSKRLWHHCSTSSVISIISNRNEPEKDQRDGGETN